MTGPVPQSAIEAALRAVDLIDSDNQVRIAHMGAALEAAMPHIRKQIAQEIRDAMPPPTTALKAHKAARTFLEQAAQIVEGATT